MNKISTPTIQFNGREENVMTVDMICTRVSIALGYPAVDKDDNDIQFMSRMTWNRIAVYSTLVREYSPTQQIII